MLLQISSGQGPVECSIGVEKLCNSLLEEFSKDGAILMGTNPDYSGQGYKSAIIHIGAEVAFLEGTILWTCQSPVRPEHKRKNWYLDVHVIDELQEEDPLNIHDCKVTTTHCGGPGGQNVNKVETGVRVYHEPTGIIVECTTQRSQYQNREEAFEILRRKLKDLQLSKEATYLNRNWSLHYNIVRGNPIRKYQGENFQRVF